jgi:hypothetical protein
VVCYIAHKGGVCVCEASRLEQPVHSAVAETRHQEDCRHEIERQLGEGGVRGAESYDCKKIWFSINHSIPYAWISSQWKGAFL